MNLLFNASNLRFGGGISVAGNLLQAIIPLRAADNIYVLAPQLEVYGSLRRYPNVSIITVPESFHRSWPVKYYHNRFVFPKLATRYQAHKIISLGNIAFPSANIPQLLLLQNAWPLYADSIAWQKLDRKAALYNRMMNAWTETHLRYAQMYALQTTVMQERFYRQYQVPESKTILLPNAINHLSAATKVALPAEGPIRLLMLSKYYPHKNFDILLPLAALIKDQRLPVTITLTIDSTESAAAKAFLQTIQKQQLQHVLLSEGHIPQEQVGNLCSRHHGLLFPTLLESFSGTYIEAMNSGLPVFTSDLDFARNTCGDSAFYFDPLNAAAILQTVMNAFSKPELLQQKTARGKALVAAMPTWQDIARRFSEIIDTFD